MQMLFRAGARRDCVTLGHDFRLMLADRANRGDCIDQRRAASFLVTACSGCGVRA